jgi:hypothetical protein
MINEWGLGQGGLPKAWACQCRRGACRCKRGACWCRRGACRCKRGACRGVDTGHVGAHARTRALPPFGQLSFRAVWLWSLVAFGGSGKKIPGLLRARRLRLEDQLPTIRGEPGPAPLRSLV